MTFVEQRHTPTASSASPRQTGFKIAFAVPEVEPLREALAGQPADATYLIQRQLIGRLTERGHALTLIAQRELGEFLTGRDIDHLESVPQSWSGQSWFSFLQKAVWKGQKVLGMPYLNVFNNLRLLDGATQILPAHDLVYERNSLYRTGLAAAARRLNIPYVLYIEADEILEHDFLGRPLTGLLRRRANQMVGHNLRAASRILCVSEPLKRHLSTKWGIPADKITVFGNGVDVDTFRPRPESDRDVRIQFEVENGPLIIFVGNFYAWHDVDTLLEAFAQIVGRHPQAHLLLIGDGDKRPEMMHRAAALGLNGSVRFSGKLPHSQIPRLVSAADIAVAPAPAMNEDFWLSPLKMYEYMASGTAIVATQVGQIESFIRNGYNGLLVQPGDAAGLAHTLERLIDDPSLRQAISQQARRDAVQHHSWDQYVDRLEQVFASVVAEARKA